MNEERYLILKMLEEGKISAEEATALLEALDESGGATEDPGAAGEAEWVDDRGRHRDHGRRRRRDHCGPEFGPGFGAGFGPDREQLHRMVEKVRLEAMNIGDEVSRQVQDAMDIWRREWRHGGGRPFRHFTRHMGDVFQVPFGREKHEESWDEEVEFGADGLVRLTSLSGEVVVHSWDQERVKVQALKRVWAGTVEEARERSADYRIHLKREGKELDIRAELADDAPGWLPARCTIDYELWVPSGCGVGVHLTNGDLQISGVGGGVELRTTNGDIVARDITGRVSVYSTNGDVELMGTRAEALVAKTVNGDLRLDLADLAAGDHDASTVHGDIEVSLPHDLQLDLRASTMHGEIGLGLPARVTTRTSTRLRARLGPNGAGAESETASGSAAGAEPEPGYGLPELNARAVFGDIGFKARREE